MRLCCLVFVGSLFRGTQAFIAVPIPARGPVAPRVPVQWGGAGPKAFLAPRVLPSNAFAPRGGAMASMPLTVRMQVPQMSAETVPCFAPQQDGTIAWGDKDWCIEAIGEKDGDAVSVSKCTGGRNQLWNWLPFGRNNKIQLKGTNKCIDVNENAGKLDAAAVELQECDETTSESWTLDKATDADEEFTPLQTVLDSLNFYVPRIFSGPVDWSIYADDLELDLEKVDPTFVSMLRAVTALPGANLKGLQLNKEFLFQIQRFRQNFLVRDHVRVMTQVRNDSRGEEVIEAVWSAQVAMKSLEPEWASVIRLKVLGAANLPKQAVITIDAVSRFYRNAQGTINRHVIDAVSVRSAEFRTIPLPQQLGRKGGVVAIDPEEDGGAVKQVQQTNNNRNNNYKMPKSLRAPLKWMGPYPAVQIRLPQIQALRSTHINIGAKPANGATIDFVLDTAANTNTINGEVAQRLGLRQIGALRGGVGAGGGMSGGTTYMLGDVELADVPEEERVPFMSGLNVTSLPVATSVPVDGLLGTACFNAFPGGVEFAWGDKKSPEVIFHVEPNPSATEGLSSSRISQLAGSGLPLVELNVNGVVIPALFDTGAPITILNPAAAKAAGLEYEGLVIGEQPTPPLSRLEEASRVERAKAAGNVMRIAGGNGHIPLIRSQNSRMSLGKAELGSDCRPYVGIIPGLTMLTGLGGIKGPAAVLGVDVLLRKPRILYTPNQVYL